MAGIPRNTFTFYSSRFRKYAGIQWIQMLEYCSSNNIIYHKFRHVMRIVPTSVVVVSTSDENKSKWGITCSSFTSVSMDPPIVSFCMKNSSQMHKLLLETRRFAINVLASDQVHYAVHFSSFRNQEHFENIPHEPGIKDLPLLDEVCAHVQCEGCNVHEVGDHHVWYGQVIESSSYDRQPLLYFARTFRNIGDETFITAFQDRTLLFEDWTHEAHLQMAWNYIKEHGKQKAIPHIKDGIKRYNEKNKEKISRGYHETVTIFYIHIINQAMELSSSSHKTFEEFLSENSYIMAKDLLSKYYSPDLLSSSEARIEFVHPDLKELP